MTPNSKLSTSAAENTTSSSLKAPHRKRALSAQSVERAEVPEKKRQKKKGARKAVGMRAQMTSFVKTQPG